MGLLLACRPGSGLAGSQTRQGQETGIKAGPLCGPPAQALPATPEGVSPAPSEDPLQRTARAALAGTYGVLPAWKRTAYQSAVDRGTTVRPGRLWVTHFWPAEGRDGQIDCRGNTCTSRTAACNQLPYGTVVWLENPCGLRTILDRGAKRNDRQAHRYGADFWLDRWAPGPRGNYMSRYAVLDNAGGKG
jgi:hypothetical protein